MYFSNLHKAVVLATALGVATLAAPAHALDNDAAEAAIGGGLGGALGAVVGNEINGRSGAILGSVIGAAGGTAIIMNDADRGHGRRERHRDHGWHGRRWHRDRDEDDWDEDDWDDD